MMRLMAEFDDLNINIDYYLIDSMYLWNEIIKRSGGSYNNGNKHWSARQIAESPFKNL